jgi:sugar phosphate isomerase/epimerase
MLGLCLLISPGLIQAGGSLMVYDFELGPNPVPNVDYVKSLGFEGIVTRCSFPSDLPKLDQYSNHVATLTGFQLLAYVEYDFNTPGNSQVWSSALPVLASRGAPLWVIVRNAPSTTALREILLRMAQRSQLVGVRTVLYPHWNTDIENAAEASALIAQIGHPNISNSLHTCHEIRAGNQGNLGAVATTHAAATALVTIAGADQGAYWGPPTGQPIPWGDAIKPLDRGDFSLTPFLRALVNSNYNGPVILHTFGITNDPGHLARSLDAYAKYHAGV